MTKTGARTSPVDLVSIVSSSRPFRELLERLESGGPLPVLGGVTGSLFSLLAVALVERTRRPLFVLVPGEEEAEGTVEDIRLFREVEVALFPSGRDGHAERTRIMAALLSGAGPRALVSAARGAVDPLPSPRAVEESQLVLRLGEKLERNHVLERLIGAGYSRESVVDRPGNFAVRGDIVDFFPRDRSEPLRIEFMEDQIDGIRVFEPSTQLSVRILEEAVLTLLAPDESTSSGALAEHLPTNVLVLARDAAALEEALHKHLARYDGDLRAQREDAWRTLARLPEILTSRLRSPADGSLNFGGQVIAPEGTSFESALATLERVSRGKASSVIFFQNASERERFSRVLNEEGPKIPGAGRWLERPFRFMEGRLHEGFHSPLLGIAALSHHELFAVTLKRRAPKEEIAAASRAIENFLDLRECDYVVHLAHGIARFEGLERTQKGGSLQDFLVLKFRDSVKLLVPASKIDLVQKYIGGRGEAPELSKLGGSGWAKRKEAVARGVTDLAAELLELQAMRARSAGIAHPPDAPWQVEFEAAFPFEITPDQARAAEDIKRDMESPKPMDRLVCGDVGYGKTEVAMRAAFKCVMGERQVAVLVPTTVLAQQHWDSFRERMRDYPVVVESLSRFRTGKEQERVLEGVASGAVDIVIGTHRLVQGDVIFKDLGLLIIDEEQRFGVGHKERLRKLRHNVDVLVMTATPIPRTLNQALLGIRDISSLNQPPRGRREVETEVIAYHPDFVRRAILRELDREGQVFFVHNRVQSIERVAKRLQDLVPEARIIVAHGQMPERSLERAMLAFLERRADILVATTIIESGLDIPSANTIFVDDADIYGLADLHQLRGRVGRWHHQAYAYFLVRPDRMVSEVAEKRLRAIEEFTRLGAGFQIAMRDMEIRGAGNILGAEQSGHIASVGYDMYCRLLELAVKRLRREDVIMPEEVEINLDFTAFLPEDYVPDRRLRIELYRKLGRAIAEDDFRQVVAEMRDRFGPPPAVAEEFVLVARIRALMERYRVNRLEIMPGEGVLLRSKRLRLLLQTLRLEEGRYRVLQGHTVLLIHPPPIDGPARLLEILEHAFLESQESDSASTEAQTGV